MITPNWVVSFLALLTLLSQVSLVLVLALLWKRYPVLERLQPLALPLAFVVALAATSGSLYFSEIAGWEPCKLCWYQRVLMYPQVVILGVAWITHATDVKRYIVLLSLIGVAVAIYHYYVQRLAAAGCSLNGGIDCTVKYTFHYGYITIPVMAATAFVLIIALLSVIDEATPKSTP